MSAIPSPPPPERPRRRSSFSTAGAERTVSVAPPAAPGGDGQRAAMKPIPLTIPADLKARMLNTMAWTAPHTGISKQQHFIRHAIAELCGRLESEHNNGQPFPAPNTIE